MPVVEDGLHNDTLNKSLNWALKHAQIYTGPNNLDSSSSKADLKARVCSPTTCLSAHRKGFPDSQCHKDQNKPICICQVRERQGFNIQYSSHSSQGNTNSYPKVSWEIFNNWQQCELRSLKLI